MTDEDLWVYLVAAGSFVLLVFASWCVGEGGEILGKKYDASIIGGLVIAWLNTAPEAIFFISALQSNNPRFAIGAVSGSTIVVCTIALGACLFIGARARKGGTVVLLPSVKQQCKILISSLIVPLATIVFGFNFGTGAFGIVFYVGFMVYSLTSKGPESSKEHDIEDGEHDEDDDEPEQPTIKGIGYLVVGGALIVLFSEYFISSVVRIATLLNVSPTLLAFFLAPIASEAPEILESVSLSRKGNAQSINVAFSNLIGGTITKTTLLCGIFSFYGIIGDFTWESPNYSISLVLLSSCALVAAWIGAYQKSQSREHGVILFLVFLVTSIVQYEYNSEFPQQEVVALAAAVKSNS